MSCRTYDDILKRVVDDYIDQQQFGLDVPAGGANMGTVSLQRIATYTLPSLPANVSGYILSHVSPLSGILIGLQYKLAEYSLGNNTFSQNNSMPTNRRELGMNNCVTCSSMLLEVLETFPGSGTAGGVIVSYTGMDGNNNNTAAMTLTVNQRIGAGEFCIFSATTTTYGVKQVYNMSYNGTFASGKVGIFGILPLIMASANAAAQIPMLTAALMNYEKLSANAELGIWTLPIAHNAITNAYAQLHFIGDSE